MASSLIHAVVCNELNKKLKRDTNKILIGTVAPDISKLIGETKKYTHFLGSDDEENIPDLDKFLSKYKNNFDDDFVLGYYIHLFTDYLWFKYFIPEIYDKDKRLITKLDGTEVECYGQMALIYIYNDYTNLNFTLTKEYNLDMSFLYEDIPRFDNIIKEAHMNKLDLVIDKFREIYDNAKVHKDMTFNMDNINSFIKLSIELIEANLEELGLL